MKKILTIITLFFYIYCFSQNNTFILDTSAIEKVEYEIAVGQGEVFNTYYGYKYKDKKIGLWKLIDYNNILLKEEYYLDSLEQCKLVIKYYTSGNPEYIGSYKSYCCIDITNIDLTTSKEIITKNRNYFMEEGFWIFFNEEGKLIENKLFSKGKEIPH